MQNPVAKSFIQAFTLMLLMAVSSAAFSQTPGKTPEEQIKALIARTYDQPGKSVETAPVVMVGGFALADWIQADMGGRALLRFEKGAWEIMACGGDDFKKAGVLGHAGIPGETAKKLIAQLEKAEQSVSPERVRRFGLFGTPNDPRLAGHHAAPHPKH